MEFDPGKCQLLEIINKLKPIISTYTVHNTPLSVTVSAKYLERPHISNILCNYNCNGTLAFLITKEITQNHLNPSKRNATLHWTQIRVYLLSVLFRIPLAKHIQNLWETYKI